jgi:type I restriction enzyme R subunit
LDRRFNYRTADVTDGKIVVAGRKVKRKKAKRCDYLLRYSQNFPIAIVEAKSKYKNASDGLQQAKEYAQMLKLKFAYATNGQDIIEFDFITGVEQQVPNAAVKAILEGQKRILLTPATGTGKTTVAFQIIYKLRNNRWNLKNEYRRPKILFLADRSVLVTDPHAKDFAIFGDARCLVPEE